MALAGAMVFAPNAKGGDPCEDQCKDPMSNPCGMCKCSIDPGGNECIDFRCRTRIEPCPTASVVIVRRNSQVFDPPLTSFQGAVAGDTFTLEIRARCWSNGDCLDPDNCIAPTLTAYQLELACSSFYSGTTGNMRPPMLDQNDPNGNCCNGPLTSTMPRAFDAFVDVNRADFVFEGGGSVIATLAFALRTGLGGPAFCSYKFGVVQVPPPLAVSSVFCLGGNQPDYYLASVRVKVSNDAAGEFTFCLTDLNTSRDILGPDFNRLQNNSQNIHPLKLECAKISVEVPDCPTTISPNTFPANAIDARSPSLLDGTMPMGIEQLDVDTPMPECLLPVHFATAFTPPIPGPTVDGTMMVDANTTTLELSGPIPPGAWTRITKVNENPATNTSVCLGFQPCDVNQSRNSDSTDITRLLSCVSTLPAMCRDYQADLDWSGQINLLDVPRGIELLIGSQEFVRWSDPTRVLQASPCGS